jgi:hypothetical protein
MGLAVPYSHGAETFFVTRTAQTIESKKVSVGDPKPLAAKYCQRTTYAQSIPE